MRLSEKIFYVVGILSMLFLASQVSLDADAREIFATALWADNSALDTSSQSIWAVISFLFFNGLPIVLPLILFGSCPLSFVWSLAQVIFALAPWLVNIFGGVSVNPGFVCRYAGWFLYIPVGIGEFLPSSFAMNIVKLILVIFCWMMVITAAMSPEDFVEGVLSSSSSSTYKFSNSDIQDDLDRAEQRSQHKQVMEELNSIHSDALNGRFRK